MNHMALHLLASVALSLCAWTSALPAAERPNVILIMTDDQGYGEIAAHGNPILKTPQLDQLHAASVRLTDFHVDPTCSPTRSALLTGRYSTRTGVWHTINGRSMMHPDELTLAELFKANGYSTAMIGKWHLGDNHPCRPEDQGFDHTVWHQGGGVDNAPDYWGNDYFDDTYKVDGAWQKFEGYCTDVWFREAIKFVEQHQAQRFFLYLTPNAPHGPYHVPDQYAEPYQAAGMPKTLAKFYGMVANIDENLGRFRARLAELGLAQNTLLIFMTDNGTTAGWIDQEARFKYFNAGMRGWKGSAWDGGHRVPCFWHWPAGGLTGGRDVPTLAAHIDILPTLADLIGLEKPTGRPLDGISLRAALLGRADALPARTLFVHVQRAFLPPKWKESAIMTQRWRLINGQELYDIIADPGQQTNVAVEHPETVQRLRDDYERWWTSLEPAMNQTVRYRLGGAEDPTTLSSHDWLMPGVEQAAWHQSQVNSGALINGAWAVDVERAGVYEISLYRWPPALNRVMNIADARLAIGDVDEHIRLDADATSAAFRVTLKKGPAMLQTWLSRPDGKQHGAYYTRVRLITADTPGASPASRPAAKPNIVFILADDLGYGDVHCLNPERGKIATPHLDRLASQGMVFTDAHSSSAVCTPTRYSILTGRYNWRSHLQSGVLGGMSPPLIAADRLTVPALLKQHGYVTACIGKWHLGMEMPKPLTQGRIRSGPTTRGFDYFFGISASLDMPPYAFIENDRFTEAPTAVKELLQGRRGPAAPGFEAVDVLPILARKSREWIGQHKEQPFFLYLALTSPHTPLAPTKEWKGKSGLGDYADFVMETDWAVGEVLAALARPGVADNTLVIVTSDNGCASYVGVANTTPALSWQGMDAVAGLEARGHFPSAGFRGYKSDAWEGGHHIPFIARWPSTVKPGTRNRQLVCLTDLMATCADLVGATLPGNAGEDSASILPLLQGSQKPIHEIVVHHSISGSFAVRDAQWKLILCRGSGGWSKAEDGNVPGQLYDLSRDEGERDNQYARHPEVVARLTSQLEKCVVNGRSTPGPPQTNDVAVDILKKGPEEKHPRALSLMKAQGADRSHVLLIHAD